MRYHFIFKFDSFVGLPMSKEPHKMQMTVCLSVASEKVLYKTVQKCGFLFHVGSLFFAEHISIALKWIDLQNFEQSQITKSCERIHCEYTHKLPRKTTVEVETFSTNCFVCVCEFSSLLLEHENRISRICNNKKHRERNCASTSTLWFVS